MNFWARIFVAVLSLCLLASTGVNAGTLYVANNGVDSAGCGASDNPCRSISKAIFNAGTGDKIVVGPGVYGDINQNGDFSDAGDESGPLGTCNCVVEVIKPVTITSRDGATATIIDASFNGLDGVEIVTSGVTFGASKKGFSVMNGDRGVRVSQGAGKVKVVANRALGNSINGFTVAANSTNVTLSGNIATENDGDGFRIAGDTATLTGNASTANGSDGFLLLGTSVTLSGNIAEDNAADGIHVTGGDAKITKNSAISNQGNGIELGAGVIVTVSQNNIFGNVSGNCGLLNNTGAPLDAKDNFWGAATGPGSDPADGACDTGGGTDTTPFASKEIKVKPIVP